MRTWPLLCLILLLAACLPEGGYKQDKDIDPDITRQVDTLNHQLLRYVASGNSRAIEALCADSIKTDTLHKNTVEIIDEIKDISRTSPYDIKYRFYAAYPTTGHIVTLLSSETSERAFEIRYTAPSRRSYVTIGYLHDSVRTIAVTTIWARFNEKWKLYGFRIGLAKVYGKDAIDWYYLARQRYADDALADALISAMLCRQLLTPSGEAMRYKLHSDMYSLGEQIKSTIEIDLHLPAVLQTVKTKPNILGMQPGFYLDGIVPAISYVSTISLRDTTALSRECDSVNAHIGEVFNKIEHYNKAFIYDVYNETPTDSSKPLPHYRFIKNTASWRY